MDKKIEKLIDGVSALAKSFDGGDYTYWYFPKSYIESNEVLKEVIDKNLHLKVSDFFQNNNKVIEGHKDFYQNAFGRLEEGGYLIHDSVRHILYNYVLFLLQEDLKTFSANVKQCSQLTKISGAADKYSYLNRNEAEIREQLYTLIKNPWALKNLIRRNFSVMRPTGNGQLIDLDALDNLLLVSGNTYDFSKFNF